MTRRLLALGGIALLTLAACGSTSSSGGLVDSPSASGSAATSADWAATDCASLNPPEKSTTAPKGAPGTDGVVVGKAASGAPSVSIAADAVAPTTLVSTDLTPGTGAEVAAGATVTANYCGVGLTSRTIFDSSWARGGEPISFGLDQVIKGWTDGPPGMKVGGTRLLIIPGDLAYGANPPGGSGIGPNEALVFVVSLTATK